MKYLIIIFLGLFLFSVNSDDKNNKKNKKQELYEKILKECSSKLDTNRYGVYDYIKYIYYGQGLDLDCFKKKLDKDSIIKANIVSKQKLNSKIEDYSIELVKITSISNQCHKGESEYFCINNLVLDGNSFFYINNDYKDISTKPIIKDLLHIKVHESTHTKNLTYDMKKKKLSELGDGDLIFKKDFILKRGVKSYWFKGDKSLGPFWYDVKVDFEGNYLELINYEGPNGRECFTYEELEGSSEKLRETFKKQNLKEFCVWRK